MKKILCAILAAMTILTLPMEVFAAEKETRLLPEIDAETSQTDKKEKADEQQAEQAPAQPLSALDILLNNADLSPEQPQSPQLAELVNSIVADITTEEMTTAEQVQACYDYLVQNTAYGSHMARMGTAVGDTTCRSIYSSYGEIEGFGSVALAARAGLCNAYACAFILMTRSIGLDVKLARGSTRRRGGGYTYHEWAELVIDGVPYVFDPQLEQDLVKSGLPAYSVYGKTYAQTGGRYNKK